MRHYERVSYRHLHDSERYRDHEYLADDSWVGANEHEPNGATVERRAREASRSREPSDVVEHWQRPRPQARERLGLRDVREVVRRPGAFVRRVVSGIFHGRGPKSWLRSDARIHDEVCELLAAHAEIDATEIEVDVKSGEVTLTGVVPDRRTKRLAEEVLDDVLGLLDVHNRLTVVRSA